VASFTRWQPPREPDDDRPILDGGPSRESSSRLPGVTISDAVVKSSAAEPQAPVRSPADARDRDDDFLQLFVNVGKRDGVNPADLQKLLFDVGIAVDPAQAIRMRDRMSFVRVSKENFDGAVAALSGQVLGGRTVVAELARGNRG
jgi:ATP-dependent RNA helicase DeaD